MSMFTIDVEIERFAKADRLARYYGIGQYRKVPKRRRAVSNAARIGIVKRLKKAKVKSKPKKCNILPVGDESKLNNLL